ncbi:hypothetical protein [Actinoallomurus iriomotensis]|uniref:Membrane-associated oxidoreductase n=1 Tax=Actinoallomurus iriomotensis TaxID=478107 RepID=A0A9W6S983_9ACTN|nr:hypothetical protein [Actinoallomurus iriomotensis]GLY89689.1 hypothetical protein Airi02_076180 [Actinoallomurus iriomotensis]
MKNPGLTPFERKVWDAFPYGRDVQFSDANGETAEEGQAWGPERSVRAEVIRRLLVNGRPADGEIASLRLAGVRVTGRLDLRHATVPYAVRFWNCRFDHAPNLYAMRIRQLNFSQCHLPGLDAATIRVDGVLRITGSRIPGAVRLGGARISGAFFLDKADLGEERSDDAERDPVLQLNHATIDDDVWAPRLRTRGQIRLAGATVTGAVNLDNADLSEPDHTVIDAENLTVGSNLTAWRLHAEGRINLRGAKIPAQVNLGEARLSNPRGVALRATSCTIGELWLGDAAPISGSVNLRGSQIGLIHAAPEVWPAHVELDGLTYSSLQPRLPAGPRLAVLERDDDGYVPHAYEQLAAAYRRVGDDAQARVVQLARQRRHRTTLVWYAKLWGHTQDATVGYGYRPTRAMTWLLGLLLLGTVVYGLHHPQPVEPGKAPDFNAFVYTLDLLLPIIDFGQEKAFNPHGAYQWLAYLLIAAGWILATTVVAGITRAVSRQ